MARNLLHLSAAVLIAVAFGGFGCSDDSSSRSGGGGGTDRPDPRDDEGDAGGRNLDVSIGDSGGGGGGGGADTGGGGGGGGGTPSERCDEVPMATNVGGACDGADDTTTCGGGACIQLEEGGAFTCAQPCFPGVCETTCDASTSCVPIPDGEGGTQTLPDGTVIGLCVDSEALRLECGDLPDIANTGETCTQPTDCGDSPVPACLNLGEGAQCFQPCLVGECEEMCAGGESCIGLADAETGEPLELASGQLLGVCGEGAPAGTQTAYQECSSSAGGCAEGLDCIAVSAGAEVGTCMPQCSAEGTCEDYMGATAQCALAIEGGSGPTHCGIACTDTAASSDCPDDLTCTSLGSGAACLR